MGLRTIPTIAALTALACMPAVPAAAADLTLNAEVSRATIDARGAEVTRSVTVSVDPGDHELSLRGLPDRIDPARVRAEVQGPARLAGLDVSREAVEQTAATSRAALEKRLEGLRESRDAARSREQSAQARIRLVETMVSSGESLSSDPEGFKELVEVADDTAGAAHRDRAAARRELKALSGKIEEVKRRLRNLGGTERETRVNAGLSVAEAGEVTLDLTYRIDRANWSPVYEVRLDTAAQELRVVKRARVTQRTGSDWSDVELSLSTQTPSNQQSMPLPGSWRLDFASNRGGGLDQMARGMGSDTFQQKSVRESAPAPQVAQLTGSRFALTYDVPGASTIPAGGQGRLVDLGRDTHAVDLTRRALPARSDAVFLLGKVADIGDAPLLGGRASLYRDGAYTGRIRIPETDAGEPVRLALGQVPGVTVDRRKLADQSGASGVKMINEQKTRTRAFETRVTNTTDRMMTVRLVERLPVPGDDRIEVEMSDATKRPDIRDLDGVSGVMAWDLTVRPGATRTVPFGYRVSWPPDERIPGF